MQSEDFICNIVEQHAEEAAFLWLLRNAVVHQPHYDLEDLAELDERIDAHLDGLRIAGDAGWQIAEKALSLQEPGEIFTAAVLALETWSTERWQTVLAASMDQLELDRAIISALGWHPLEKIAAPINRFLDSTEVEQQYLGIAALAVHRIDPGYRLDNMLINEDSRLRSRALRTAGELGRQDLLPKILQQIQSDDEATRFWAAWSATLLGDRNQALETLKPLSLSSTPLNIRALQVLLRSLNVSNATDWQRVIAQDPKRLRHLIIGMGIIGDPTHIPWLITQMENPEVARIAGETFTFITGANLSDEDLEGEQPAGFESGPTEDPDDESVDLDPDEDLPWPNPALIHTWWQKHQSQYHPQTRYLIGKPITAPHCQSILITGFQRQRHAAALELALLQPSTPLFETRALGLQQQRQLIK
jgi:uncharacterized protein (TIGR02270 family)